MRIAMIGAGYVGPVSGACFSNCGHHVICIDSDEDKIAALKSRRILIQQSGSSGSIATPTDATAARASMSS
jgi:UDPglucose 6-dehydrogenase